MHVVYTYRNKEFGLERDSFQIFLKSIPCHMSENMCGSETFDGIPEVPDEVGGMVERAGGIDKIVRGLPSEDVLTEKCQIFAALSSSVRLRIMYILAGADLCPSAIKVLTGMSESRISYHLDILEGAGLVKHGPWQRWRIYSLTEEGRAFMYASERSDANAI